MSNIGDIFTEEWTAFMKKNGYRSVAKAIEALEKKPGYIPFRNETISNYKRGNFRNKANVFPKEELRYFAGLFGVLPEYLEGKSPYRTARDLAVAQKKMEDITHAFHTLLVNMGYGDLDMDEDDFNYTMAPNTNAFLHYMSEHRTENNILCDIRREKYLEITAAAYRALAQDIANYTAFRLSQLMNSHLASDIPQMEYNGNILLRNHTQLELKDGSDFIFDFDYLLTKDLIDY